MALLIRNGTVLTVDAQNRILRPGWIRIADGRIEAVGPEPGPRALAGEREIDAGGMVVMPGLINGHAHLTDSLLRSLGADLPLLDWLEALIWPFFAEANADEVRAGAQLGCLEAIQSGTTTIVENYYSARHNRANVDVLAGALAASGLRVALVRGYHDRPSRCPAVFVEETADLLAEYDRIIDTWHGHADGRLMTWVGPVDLLSSEPASIAAVHALARRRAVRIHSHVAETQSELELIRQDYGAGYVAVLDSLGVLDERFSCAHGVWVDESEIALLAERRSAIVHNPVSNMYLGAGVAPVPEMLAQGVTVALGTDGACCNNTLDMIETMKAAALLHKVRRCDPAAISAGDVLRMATVHGARLLGLQDEIGSLEAGKKADVILVDFGGARTTPAFDPVAGLVYSAQGSDVNTVLVDGNILMDDRVVQVFDEGTVLRQAEGAARDLARRVPQIGRLADRSV